MTRNLNLVNILLVIILIVPLFASSARLNYDEIHPSCREHWGPNIDKLVYIFIENEDSQILALLDDEIDLIDHPINSSFFDRLLEADNIKIAATPTNSYMGFVFNCAKYPFNITAFRRSFAYALDKEQLADLWIDSEVQTARPLDACIIQASPFSAEGQLEYNYIQSDIEEANRLLDTALFFDIDSDGYRENPDGSKLSVVLEYYSLAQPILNACLVATDTFATIGINVTCLYNSAGFGFIDNGYFIRPHGNFDVAYVQYDFENLEVNWLANEYWSEYADELFLNKPKFRNETFDSYRDLLLHAIDYDDVKNAAIEMQKIIAYECPIVVSHEFYDIYAYRTDRFENYLNEITIGPGGWYSLCQLHLKDELGGPFGGTFRIGTSDEIQTFNLLNSNGIVSGDVLNLMYDSLLKRYPDGTIGPLLSTNWILETHSINENVSEGSTRITFKIDLKAVWTDSIQCSADDVVFSINYYRELEGHWLQDKLEGLSAAYVRGNDAVFEFSTESYWHLHDIGFIPIIPKHFFEKISTDSIFDYNPHPPYDGMITLGPFNVSDYVAREFLELTYYPNYYHLDSTDIAVYLGPSHIYWKDDEVATLYSGQEYVIKWQVYGGCNQYTIYIDGTAYMNSSTYKNRITHTISTGPILFTTGHHTAKIVVSDYHGTNYTDLIEFIAFDSFMVSSGALVSSATLVIGIYVILRKDI